MTTPTHKPHGVNEWRLDRLATFLVIPATPILIYVMYLWDQNFTFNPVEYFADYRIALALTVYLLLTSFFNVMSLKAIIDDIDDYVKGVRLLTLCWFALILFVTVMPILTIALLLKQVIT